MGLPGDGFLRNQGLKMRLSDPFPQFRTVLAIPFLAAMLAFPASAETTPNGPPAATQSAPATPQTGPNGAPASSPSNPDTSATSPNGAPAATQSAPATPQTGQNGAPAPSSSNPGTSATSPNGAPAASPSSPATPPTGTQAAPQPAGPAGETNGTSEPDTAESAPSAPPEKPKSSVVINIDKSSQEMTVFVDGVELYSWPVSTGLGRGYATPAGSYTASSMNEIWYSKQWDNAPMPHSIFFTKQGHAIHGTKEVKHLGKPASHGCVRLSPENAATLYALVEANGLPQTQVVLTGKTPGGEGPKVASPGRYPEGAYPPWFGPGYGYPPPNNKKRRGIFGRRWFDGPQGYYEPRGNRYYYPQRRGY